MLRDQVVLAHAAREAGRAAAVTGDPAEIRRAAVEGSGLDPDRLVVTSGARGGPGSRVRVDVRYESPTDVPLVGAFVGSVRSTQSVTIRVES